MLTEDRLKHSLGVARKCYAIAERLNKTEEFCRKMFLLGYIHDAGYEFGTNEDHAEICADILQSMGLPRDDVEAVRSHSVYTGNRTLEWTILSMADLMVDSSGNDVDVLERLQGMKERYGEHSNQYLTACDIAYIVGLTSRNIAENIT